MTEEEKKAIEKLSSKKNETSWIDTIRHIKREDIKKLTKESLEKMKKGERDFYL